MPLRRVTLEVSLKAFFATEETCPEAVAERMFGQWGTLTEQAEEVGVLIWAADGSEILDYRGDLDGTFEWAYWIGAANPREKIAADPERECLHARPRKFRENPPAMTWRKLGGIVAMLRRVGQERTGKRVYVGATFDPGGEFALSSFKYERHNEICLANTMGKGSFVCCYARLHADSTAYAGFAEGIPEGLAMGTFLGRQAQRFLADLGFDYLWFSNGFGFGMETWKPTGPLFDGKAFAPEKAVGIRDQVLEFWRLFRAECSYPIETRGTNLGTGADLATDAVPLRELYRGGFGMATPPNSPWAAINGDFGIELVGYMSRIAETAEGGEFPFRYYTHDPWWLNSPWLDRYGRQPHDIYLPLSVARMDAAGRVQTPGSVALLTVDDSLGRMPEQVPMEVIPHLLEALRRKPDAPGPVVWVYPFDENHERAFATPSRLEEPFFNDWFVSRAVNDGFPVNTVVSSENYLAARRVGVYGPRVLLAPVPDAGSALNDALLEQVAGGGRVLLYGPVAHADGRMMELLGLERVGGLEGEMVLELSAEVDAVREGTPRKIVHRLAYCAGAIDTVLARDAASEALAEVEQGSERRVVAVARGNVAWVRGTNHSGLPGDGVFPMESLLRVALARLGMEVSVGKHMVTQRNPITTIASHGGGLIFSGYVPDTTVEVRLRFAEGAPLLTDGETELRDGRSTYRFGRAWRQECRVFVQQGEGIVSCIEAVHPQMGVRRRLQISGLKSARVTFCPEPGYTPVFRENPVWPFVSGPTLTPREVDGRLVVENVSGVLMIAW